MARTFANLLTHLVFSTKTANPVMTFQEEFIAMLERNEIEYDERYIWE